MHRYFRILMAALLFAAIAIIPVNAQSIPAEDDAWVTGNGTQVDFSNFGTISIQQLLGSQPVNSVVSFVGSPINQSQLGSADTLISRGSSTVADRFTTSLSIKGLSLTSSPNMTLQDGRVYRVDVSLATQSDNGSITFTKTTSEGGTFSSSFTVTPIFTFTNVNNSSEAPHTANCASFGCSFAMSGSGNWVLTSSTGFDPQSMGIPVVPSGVQVGSYATTGKARYGGIQVGCGGTKSSGYGCGQNNELHGEGSIGQALHGTKPPNDCSSSPPPPPAPSPTPVATGGGCATTTGGLGGCTSSRGLAMQKPSTKGQATLVTQTDTQLCSISQ